MGKTILFYAALKDVSFFYHPQKFFLNTREILEKLGYKVVFTIKMSDALNLKYDALFCFFFRQGVIPALFAKIRGKKVFFTGGLDDLEKSLVSSNRYLLQALLFNACKLLADWCLIESKADLLNIDKICIFNKRKNLYYSPQAINVKEYNCSLEEKDKLFSTICWQGTIGNCKRKGVDQALFYFKMLKETEEFRDYKFIIMGREGMGTHYLRDIISKLGLGESVRLIGEVSEEEKINYLKKSKFFFQLSLYEGFGLAALEAVASKCIPIHTARGGLSDTLSNDGVVIDYKRFDGTRKSLDSRLKDQLLSITNKDVEESYQRIARDFDVKVRYDNFRKTIGCSLK